jgi:hypothetical protein
MEIYVHAASLLFGLIAGLVLARLTRKLIAVIAFGGTVAAVLIITGHGQVLVACRGLLPQALELITQVAATVKTYLVILYAPGALVGTLSGLAIRLIVSRSGDRG